MWKNSKWQSLLYDIGYVAAMISTKSLCLDWELLKQFGHYHDFIT